MVTRWPQGHNKVVVSMAFCRNRSEPKPAERIATIGISLLSSRFSVPGTPFSTEGTKKELLESSNKKDIKTGQESMEVTPIKADNSLMSIHRHFPCPKICEIESKSARAPVAHRPGGPASPR